MSLAFLRRAGWLLALVCGFAPSRPSAAFDVLVGSAASPRVSVVDGATGELEGFLVAPCDSGFSTTRGPRLGADGRVYVGTEGAVYRVDASTGGIVDVFVSGQLGTAFFNVTAPDGSLWVSFGSAANAVVRFDGSTGLEIGRVALANPIALAIGPDGNVYAGAGTQIWRIDATTGALIGTFGDPLPAAMAGLALGPDGDFYAATNSNDVVRVDGTTGVTEGSFIRAGDPHPSGPRGPTWGPDGNLWVSSNATGELLRYDPTGAFLGVFASGLDSPGAPGFVPDLPSSSATLPAVATSSGPIAGFLECGVRKYLGIHYAEAPTGDLRWRRPVRKAESQTEVRALAHGAVCPQHNGTSAIGSEDCLALSIWRPDAPPATPLPVLFFIHGGGLTTGSMSWAITDGSHFAHDQNVIVVDVQYRLGALALLGLPELVAEDANGSTGNYGFLDQLEALRWVRDNIAAFGGDPNQVTISGQSAGGWSTCTLLASPLSDGLFRAAIVQSGMCQNARPLALPDGSPLSNDPFFGDTVFGRGEKVAANSGCTDAATRLECLRSAPASSLVQAYAALPRNVSNEQPANPAIDGYVLTEQPVVMLRQGAADGRPLAIGTTANETTYFSNLWEYLITTPALYETFLRAAAGNTRADALLPLYPAASYPTPAEAFRTLIDDTLSVCPTLDTADAARAGGSPAFVYHLTFPPSYATPPAPPLLGLRTFHGLDLYYVFGTYARLASDYGIVVGPNDAAVSESMQAAWGSFVRTGVPATTPAWPPYEPATPGDLASVSVLQFDVPNTTVTGSAFRSGRCASFFPVANQLDPDRDIALPADDSCPTLPNSDQADVDGDAVGNVCDSCITIANPRVAADYLTANPWATLTGDQRDDDHDGYGNRCDAKFAGSYAVNSYDLGQFRASNGKPRSVDTCGTTGTRPCAIFDLDETGAVINSGDLGVFRLLNGKAPGPKCPTCPLACSAGVDGSCGP